MSWTKCLIRNWREELSESSHQSHQLYQAFLHTSAQKTYPISVWRSVHPKWSSLSSTAALPCCTLRLSKKIRSWFLYQSLVTNHFTKSYPCIFLRRQNYCSPYAFFFSCCKNKIVIKFEISSYLSLPLFLSHSLSSLPPLTLTCDAATLNLTSVPPQLICDIQTHL